MDQSDLFHGNGKKPISGFRRRYCSSTAVTLLLFVLTNTVSILVSSGAVGPSSLLRRYNYKPSTSILPLMWDDSAALAADLNATQALLAASRAELAGLHARVGTANELLRTLLAASSSSSSDFDGWAREPTGELKLAIAGPSSGTKSEHVVAAAVGLACRRVQDDLERYMSYIPGGACPSDNNEAQLARRLMLAGCDPLPRRRCRPPSPPKGYPPPSVAAPQERRWWARDDGKLEYSVDAVLRTRPNGTVRVGLDVTGAGAAAGGTFAARMMERGVTVVTAAVDDGGAPVGGFVPVRVGSAQRLPFFDGTLDIVHQLGGGGEWVSTNSESDEVMLEFAMFDVYRVLRPGGLFWIDHFVCPSGAKLNTTFAPMIDRVGFKKLRWNTARKLRRRGTGNDGEWYVSALLERPMS
ncbi:hypothetical protein PR202_ga30899 [Eleusine coracana subsp. coracana]|uniref:Methyltransferase type 11 domain-containing protein n=1 Tax=Eleusine coracana subsp. coracana TaxID=191504 RepID=A0AAV5DQL9_ELECO|nr:hypothetical protein QOZ80_8AG0615260 [Eleusine coracana subsp. coracana]GJN12608.1 hypothetical protein PR202_ga30899 [Eleusine coracana subsp. coracana]